jgi:serine/threonine-protein kinase
MSAELPPALLGEGLELIEELGRGGMGIVYKARDLRLGRWVAVKFVAGTLAAEPEMRRRFEREARALARVSHPNIVAVYDLGQDEDRSYIVMEYVDGRPLSERIPVDEAAARRIAIQVLDGLGAAHRQGIVHRDIKPANILIGPNGDVKITDFGIARLVGEDAAGWTVTDPKGVVGTRAYLAPEALAGSPPDPRMDVYALGVVLYEMLKGRPPLGDFEPLAGSLNGVVRKALASDPDKRYASTEEMRRDLAESMTPPAAALLPHERNWLRAVAALQSLATALALWAFLLSVTPRVIGPYEVMPLVMVGGDHLADGRTVSWARFETGPSLAALGVIALALLAYGLLRRHWREAGLDTADPGRPVEESWQVFAWGLFAVCVYVVRRGVEEWAPPWASRYIPVLGGVTETVVLFFFWVAVLQAWRASRPLRREPRLWIGFGLALCPPAIELLRYLLAWHP